MTTNVAQIIPLNSYDKLLTIGEEFETYPEFQILDFYGKSIEGKIGVMFSWVEPKFGEEEGVENHITA